MTILFSSIGLLIEKRLTRKIIEIKNDQDEFEEEILESLDKNEFSNDSREDFDHVNQIMQASTTNNSNSHSQTIFLSDINNSMYSIPITPPPSINIESSTSVINQIINDSSKNSSIIIKKKKHRRVTSINTLSSDSKQFKSHVSEMILLPPPPSPSNTF